MACSKFGIRLGNVVHLGAKFEETFRFEDFESVKKYFDLIGAIIVVLDLKGNVKYVNHYGCSLLGYSFEEVVDKNWFENFIPSEIRGDLKNVFSKIVSTNYGIRSYHYYENPVLTKSGEERVIAWNNILIESDEGHILGTLSTGIDITERAKVDTVKKAFEEKLATLNYFSSALNTAKSFDEVYERVVDGLTRTLGFEYAMFLIVEKDRLKVKAYRGLEPTLKELPLKSQKGLTVKAVRTRRTVVSNDTWMDEDYIEGVKGVRSELCTPVIVNDTVYGVIDVQSRKVNAFSNEDARLVEILATHTATAVSNIEKQSSLEKQYRQLSNLMKFSIEIIGVPDVRTRLQKVVEAIRSLGWGRVVLSLRDENLEIRGPDDIITAGVSEEEKVFLWENRTPGKVWRERLGTAFSRYKIGQFYYIPYEDQFAREAFARGALDSRLSPEETVDWHPQDLLYAPLKLPDGRVVGILSVDDPVDGRRPTKYSLAPLELFLNYAAIAIENAQLIEKLEEAHRKLREYALELEAKVEERTRELVNAQEKLLRSERLATIGEVAASVGHDLRNPLQVLLYECFALENLFEKVSKGGDEGSKAALTQHLQRIREQINYMNKIVSDLQDYGRQITVKTSKVDLNSLIKNVLSTVKIPENVKVVLEVPTSFSVDVDPEIMKRVFVNLVTNAVQAMPEGGTLTISSRIEEGAVKISFKDTGVGISKENLDKIFQPLFTTKAKGTGLGLAVCKRIIEAHNGTIEVESELGKGSTFTIKIPVKS